MRPPSTQSAFARSIALDLPEAGLLTCRSSQNRLPSRSEEQWPTLPAARCLQWRDRAGFSPASLFTRPNGEHLKEFSRYHIGANAVNRT